MNTVTLPNWYLWLSIAFFAIVCLLFVALVVLVYKLIQVVNRLEPKVSTLITQVNDDVLPQVKNVTSKVETLTETVNSIGNSIKGITSGAQGLMQRADSAAEKVSGTAGSLADALSGFVGMGFKRLERFAPYIGLAYQAMDIYKKFGSVRSSSAASRTKKVASKAASNVGSESPSLPTETKDPKIEDSSKQESLP